MSSTQNQRDTPSTADPLEQEHSADSTEGGEVKPSDGASSPASPSSPSTKNTEASKLPGLTQKQKHLYAPDYSGSDSDSDYETIKVLKGHPRYRDPTELPIIAETAQGVPKILWARMDTGADVNIIAEKVVERLGYTSRIEALDVSEGRVEEVGGNHVQIDRKITLSFKAGRHNRLCRDVEFWIPEQKVDSDSDGVADVLLGWKELLKHHMVMIDYEFCNEPEEGLEVLAKPPSEECPGRLSKSICHLPIKFGQVKTRPYGN